MNKKHIRINEIGLINNGKTLFAHSDNEFFFWSLGNSVQKLKFEGTSLNFSFLQVSPEKSHFFFKPYYKSLLYKINFENHMLIEKRMKVPTYFKDFKFVCNGDAIIYIRDKGKNNYKKKE